MDSYLLAELTEERRPWRRAQTVAGWIRGYQAAEAIGTDTARLTFAGDTPFMAYSTLQRVHCDGIPVPQSAKQIHAILKQERQSQRTRAATTTIK